MFSFVALILVLIFLSGLGIYSVWDMLRAEREWKIRTTEMTRLFADIQRQFEDLEKSIVEVETELKKRLKDGKRTSRK